MRSNRCSALCRSSPGSWLIRPRKLAGVLARLAIVVGASIGLLAAAHTSLETTASLVTPSSISGWNSTYVQHSCLRAVFRHAVPKGTSVYVGGETTPASQLLLEAAALWANPVLNESSARWIVSLQPGNECVGYTLHAQRRRP